MKATPLLAFAALLTASCVRFEAESLAAGATSAGKRPNPVFSFSPAYNSSSSGISPWIISPTFDVPLETAGKRGYRIDQARAEAESARLMVSAAAWDARAKVRQAMLENYAGQKTADLLESGIALHQAVLTTLEAQVKAGEAPAFELTQARPALGRAQLALHDAEQATETTGRMVAAGELGQPDLLRRRIEASAASLSQLEARLQAQEALGALEAALQLPLSPPR